MRPRLLHARPLVPLIGLGVGVDYALFIVTRFRQGLRAGLDVETAVVTSVQTAGRAVFFAGSVVCIALLGMLALGVSILNSVGIAAGIGVAFTIGYAPQRHPLWQVPGCRVVVPEP